MARKPFVSKLSDEAMARANEFENKIDVEIDKVSGSISIVIVRLHPGKDIGRNVFAELNRRYVEAGWFAMVTSAGVVFLFPTANLFYHHICQRAQNNARADREYAQGNSSPRERPDGTYPRG